MKVLLISKYARTGGAAIATYRLKETLRDHSVEAGMLVQEGANKKELIYDTTGSVFKRWINFFRFIIERLVFLRYEKANNIRFLFSLANTGERIERHRSFKEADIVHLHWINGGFLSLRSVRRILNSGKPVVWTLHDMWAFTGGCHYALDCEGYKNMCGDCPYLKNPHEQDLSHRIWKKKEQIFSNQKFTIITPSNWLAGCTRSSSLLKHCEVYTIANPVDQTLFRPVDRESACRNLELDPGKKYILFGAANVGNMLKGFDYFVEAIELLNKDIEGDHNVEIIVFGKLKVDVAGLFPFVTHTIPFTGSLKRIVDIYSAAHLFSIPSLQDNLPNTIVESMLCGTPVVGFNTGGITEMIDHMKNGYLAQYLSGKDLAEGMKWVLALDYYDTLSSATRSIAVKRFSRERSTEMHVELYRKILGQV